MLRTTKLEERLMAAPEIRRLKCGVHRIEEWALWIIQKKTGIKKGNKTGFWVWESAVLCKELDSLLPPPY